MDAINAAVAGYIVAELKSGNDGTGTVAAMAAQSFTGGS
jgi:hypothetical protein